MSIATAQSDTTTPDGNTDQSDALKRQEKLYDPLIQALEDNSRRQGIEVDQTAVATNSSPNPLSEGLQDAMLASSARAIVDALQADIRNVTDPVAFMTSAKKTKTSLNKNAGNFDLAIQDLNNEDGFYEQAKKKCTDLHDTLKHQLSMIGPSEVRGYNNLIQLMADYRDVYQSFQELGNISKNHSKSGERTLQIKAQLGLTGASLKNVPESLLDAGVKSSIDRCITEMLMFTEAWKSAAGTGNAGNNMAKLFLQTTERARSQLNAYDLLDDRNNADTTGTSSFKISKETGHTIHDADEAKQRMDEQGGVMAVAMKSYHGDIRQDMLRELQMKAVLERLKNGEFSDEEACVKAFKQTIGSGGTSDRYQGKLEEEARGHWRAYTAGNESTLEKGRLDRADGDYTNGKSHVNKVDPALSTAKKSAKSSKDNLRDYSNLSEKEKSTLLKGNTLSAQERARLEMDQKNADLAYSNALRFKGIAEQELKAAKTLFASGEANMAAALTHHNTALQNLAQARLHASHIGNTKDRALSVGLHELNGKIQQVESSLAANDEIRKQLKTKRLELEQLIKSRTRSVMAYNPARLKVPQPEIIMNGKKLENMTYAKTAIDLTGPAWGVFWWMGGAEGELSRTASVGENGAEDWTKAGIKIYAGLKANLWLVEAGVKVSGSLEAKKKNCDPNPLIAIPDVLISGAEEIGRWAYANWYNLGSMATELNTIMNVTNQVGGSVYDKLIQDIVNQAGTGDSIDQLAGAVTKADKEMRQLHSGLKGSLREFYSSGKGKTKIDPTAIEQMANEAVPLNDLTASLRNVLKATESSEPVARLSADKSQLSKHISKTQKDAVSEIKKVDPGQNNPDVQFEAGVGIEGFVGSSFGGSANLSFSAAKVWSVKDGDGDAFDYSMHEKTVYTGQLSVPMKSGASLTIKLTGEPKGEKDGGGWEFGLEADVPISHSDEDQVDGKEIVENMRDFFEGQSTGPAHPDMAQKWIKSLPKKLSKQLLADGGLESLYTVNQTSTTFIKVGGSMLLDKDWAMKKWAVKFGVFQKLERSSKMGSLSVEKGNITTFTSEDAKQSPKKKTKAERDKEEALRKKLSGPD